MDDRGAYCVAQVSDGGRTVPLRETMVALATRRRLEGSTIVCRRTCRECLYWLWSALAIDWRVEGVSPVFDAASQWWRSSWDERTSDDMFGDYESSFSAGACGWLAA